MANIIYSKKITDTKGCQFTTSILQETFEEAIYLHKKIKLLDKNVAYFFIDPLLNDFKAANQFYFELFDCDSIGKMNTYKSGASPIQALFDAQELMECGLYDAVFLFGYEPLLTNRQVYGKEAVTKGMSIFENDSILQCYNKLAHKLCEQLALSKQDFTNLSDKLFKNYRETYSRVTGNKASSDRGRRLGDIGADLFTLTDCANPNIDFAGGVILANDDTAHALQTPDQQKVKLLGVRYTMVEGSPEKIDEIVGTKENIFPHLRHALEQVEHQSNVHIAEQFKNRNLFLEVYTCYPPVPIGFLLASGIINNIDQLPNLLERYEITITGGMNVARAPWNNPALNGLVDMHQKLIKEENVSYGVVHGNGGIGETQGVALLEKNKT